MKLGKLLTEAVVFIETPICVKIVSRDSNGIALWIKRVEISHIKTDFDGQGIELVIEEQDIKEADWSKVL